MMNKVFSLITSFKDLEESEKGVTISGMASTNDIDRVGDVISPDAWKKGGLENFKRNPIILFNHDPNMPIGKATDVGPNEKGLGLKAFISKHAPNGIAELIKDGVLGAFSVGFMVKDADYIEETGGLKIKDAELFEVSVVSIPANQAATFSLAKSFESMDDYEEFKKLFIKDLADQPLTEEVNASNVSDTSEAGEENTIAEKEITMAGENTPNVDFDALVKQAAKEAAADLAMKQAKENARKQAEEEARKAEEDRINTTVKAGVSGVEKLVEDLQNKFNEREANFSEVIASLKEEIDAKSEEIKAFNNSKRIFVDRTSSMSVKDAIKANGDEFMKAYLYGVITRKGWNTEVGKEVIEKAGMDYTTDTTTGDLDQEVRDMIEKELWMQTRVASLFRELQVNGRATVLPLQTDTDYAEWYNLGRPDGTLQNRTNSTANTYKARSVTLTVDRMISSTYMDNDVDEKTLVTLLPMLFDGVARAHARKIESAIVSAGDVVTHVDDLESAAPAATVTYTPSNANPAATLLEARAGMGKYGLIPSDIAYIVSTAMYYELLQDVEFQNLNEVGDIAIKLRGVVGGIFGSPVIVSEELTTTGTFPLAALIVNRNNYVIPRLRGVNVETDYEVANQRRMIVASQSLGFTELFAGDGAGHEPVIAVAQG